MRHLKVEQSNALTESVSMELLSKLYNLVNSNDLDNASSLRGMIYLPYIYEEYVIRIKRDNPGLTINTLDYYILFEDKLVESLLYSSFNIGDGIGITKTQAAEVTNLDCGYNGSNSPFKLNTDITSFNELKYFTNVKTITYGTFQQATNLRSINLCNITKIESYAFGYCRGLTNIKDGSKITSVGAHAFHECVNLIDVNIKWENIISLSWDSAFSQVPITGDIILTNCVGDPPEPSFIKTQIRSITYGSGITGTGSGGRVMNLGWANYISSPNLVFVDLSRAYIVKMKEYGYNNCNTMKLIKIPSSVTQFGNFVFTGCTALEAIVLYATTPPAYAGETYNNMDETTPMLFNRNTTLGATREYSPPNATVRLYVPKDSLSAYQLDSAWGKYSDIMLTIEDDYTDPDYYTETFQND